jgi:hypothetical protein
MLQNKENHQKDNLSSLLLESKRLTSHIVSSSALPFIDKSLDLISASSKRLVKHVGQDTKTLDPKSAFLLSSQGFDPQKLQTSLQNIQLTSTYEPLEAVMDTDLNSFLKNETDNMISTAIQESRLSTIKEAETCFEKKLYSDWRQRRQMLLEDLGSVQPSCKFCFLFFEIF